MKKILVLVTLIAVAVFFFNGCDEDPASPIEAPRNLNVIAKTDGITLTVSWAKSLTEDEEDGIDGYVIEFDGVEIDDVASGTLEFDYEPTSLGTFSVFAYRDEDESDKVSVSTTLAEHQDITLASWTGTDPSSIGWTRSSGMYTLYSTIGANAPDIDLVYDSRDLTLNSGDVIFDAGDNPNATWIALDDGSGIVPAEGNYQNFREMVVGQAYVLWLNDDYYVQFEVTNITGEDIMVNCGFQLLEGYTRIE